MIAAMAYAGRALNEKSYIQHAERAMDFILTEMKNNDGGLKKRFRKGKSGLSEVLDDYAFVVWGLIELVDFFITSPNFTISQSGFIFIVCL